MLSEVKTANYAALARRASNITKLVSDWDATITASDTLHLLFKHLPKDAKHDIAYFSKVYMDTSDNYHTNVLPLKSYKDRKSVADEISYQKDMRAIESSSFDECVKVGTFKGIRKAQLEALYTECPIMDGFPQFWAQNKLQFEVVSVNWTGAFIKKYFSEVLNDASVKVHSDELEFKDGVCTGRASNTSLRTGYDKLVKVKRHTEGQKFAYIGDSSTDVLSMIYSDLAFIIKGGSAAKTLQRLGYRIFDIEKDKIREDQEVKFVLVSDWFDLLNILNSPYSKL